jgi:hypothetical protein
MTRQQYFSIRLIITLGVSLAIWMLLAWNYFHGGVPSHHILANKDLPQISNAWGALVLPLLTWLLLYRVQQSMLLPKAAGTHTRSAAGSKLLGFGVALLFGATLAACFSFGYPEACGYMVLALFPLALFVPIYGAQFLLGFVLGMTFTFGAILPAVFGALLCMAGFLLYQYIRPALRYMGALLYSASGLRK